MAKIASRRIYILPNLLTSGNFFCGILAITLSLDEKFYYAALAILVGTFFDALDGAAARRNRSSSRFGLEYDSLTDLVSFGIAPMIMVYCMELHQLGSRGRMGLAIAFLYSVCTALRLARFSARSGTAAKRSFTGLPSPAAAGFLAAYVMFMQEYHMVNTLAGYVPFIMIILSYLMISNFEYPRLPNAELTRKKPFVYLAAVLLLITGAILFIHEVLFFSFSLYLLRGPAGRLYLLLWKRRTAAPLEARRLQGGN